MYFTDFNRKYLKVLYQIYLKSLFYIEKPDVFFFNKEVLLCVILYIVMKTLDKNKIKDITIDKILFNESEKLQLLFISKNKMNIKKKKIVERRKKLGWAYPVRRFFRLFKFKKSKKIYRYYFSAMLSPVGWHTTTYDLMINIKKKNLFLTFLDHNKNVLVKSNVGKWGFKGKFKFTNDSLLKSSNLFKREFYSRLGNIALLIYNRIWFFLLNFISGVKKKKSLKKYMLGIRSGEVKKKLWNKVSFLMGKSLLAKSLYFKLLKYRKTFGKNIFSSSNIKKNIKKIRDGTHLVIVVIYKTNPKDWPFRFVVDGLFWWGVWRNDNSIKIPHMYFSKFVDKRPCPHSKGFRIRKARRV